MYETRNALSAEYEERSDGKLAGTAIVFGSESVDFGGWSEIISPGAIELDDDLYLDYDHDSKYILGRRSNGTLDTETTPDGVTFEAEPPDTTFTADLRSMMQGGYVRGCSFMFECLEDVWQEVGGKIIRTIKRARVLALTITGIPAYPETASEARSRCDAFLEERACGGDKEKKACGDKEKKDCDEGDDEEKEPEDPDDEGEDGDTSGTMEDDGEETEPHGGKGEHGSYIASSIGTVKLI